MKSADQRSDWQRRYDESLKQEQARQEGGVTPSEMRALEASGCLPPRQRHVTFGSHTQAEKVPKGKELTPQPLRIDAGLVRRRRQIVTRYPSPTRRPVRLAVVHYEEP